MAPGMRKQSRFSHQTEMKAFIFLFICSLMGQGLCGKKQKMVVRGTEGDDVSFSCPYEDKDKTNAKYLCTRCSFLSEVTLIKSTDLQAKGRFSLNDDRSANTFTVTIKHVTVNDSGTYHCAIDISWRPDDYQEVELHISADEKHTNPKGNSVTASAPDDEKTPKPTEEIAGGNSLEDPETYSDATSHSGESNEENHSTTSEKYDSNENISSIPPSKTEDNNTSNSEDNDSTSENTHTTSVIVGAVCILLLMVVVLLIMWIYWRKGKRNLNASTSADSPRSGNDASETVKIPQVSDGNIYTEPIKAPHQNPGPSEDKVIYSLLMPPNAEDPSVTYAEIQHKNNPTDTHCSTTSDDDHTDYVVISPHN